MWRMLLLTAFALCQWSAPAFALPIQWTLEGVTFSDGASAFGTFVYDADTNEYTDINITTTTASRPGAMYAFVCVAPCTGVMPDQNGELNLTTSPSSDQTGLPGFALFFDPPLSNSGGLRAVLGALEADCSNSTCVTPTGTERTAAGSVVALVVNPAPAPALSSSSLVLVVLLLAACGGFGIAAQRRSASQ